MEMEVELIRQKKFGKTFSIAVIVAYFILLIYSGLNLISRAVSDMILSCIQPVVFIVTAIVLFNEDAISFRDGLFIKKFKPKYLLIAVVALLGLFFGFGHINSVIGTGMEKAGLITLASIEMESFNDYVLYVIGTAGITAIGEEVLFRGVILYGLCHYCVKQEGALDGRSQLKISLIIGIIFSAFHKNPAQLIYQFACGTTFALITLKSGSIFPSIIIHFLNNFIILTFAYFAPNFNPLGWIQTGIGLAVFIGAFIVLLKDGVFSDDRGEVFTAKGFFSSAWVGIAFCFAIILINIVTNVFTTYIL